ncbi:MAG: hypothetical protein ACE366_19915 [Bradymonadia bacterium]
MRVSVSAALCLCLAGAFSASAETMRVQSSKSSAGAPSWSAQQAVGVADVPTAGDDARAWATLQPNAGAEWLEVDFARATVLSEVHVYESFNPGAVVKIEALSEEGPITIWSGGSVPETAMRVLKVKARRKVKASGVKIHLDTTRVNGWNEIDAVSVRGADGTLQWATEARASSSYASASGNYQASFLYEAVGKRVMVKLSNGEAFKGTVVATDGNIIKFQYNQSVMLIPVQSVVYLTLLAP